ncbi:MAG: phosphatidate cytidylyltransferase [Pseudohongiellaceae bacterium]
MLRQRVVTAICMLAVLYLATAWLPVTGFAVVLSAFVLPALLEWSRLMGLPYPWQHRLYALVFYLLIVLTVVLSTYSGTQLSVLIRGADWVLGLNGLAILFWLLVFVAIVRYPQGTSLWDSPLLLAVAGWLTLLPVWWNLVYLKLLDEGGLLVFALIALVSIVDIGAYFSGRAWGRRKLAPALSPNKSWAGFWGGLFACVALALLLVTAVHVGRQPLEALTWAGLTALAVLLGVASVVGDLFESMLKRQRGVKDSGQFLPGHGGLLDRVDSLLAATPVFTLGVWFLASRVAWL